MKDLQAFYHLASLQYANAQSDYLNVLIAERDLFASELDLATITARTFFSLIDIYKALGGGWVVDADECIRGCP